MEDRVAELVTTLRDLAWAANTAAALLKEDFPAESQSLSLKVAKAKKVEESWPKIF